MQRSLLGALCVSVVKSDVNVWQLWLRFSSVADNRDGDGAFRPCSTVFPLVLPLRVRGWDVKWERRGDAATRRTGDGSDAEILTFGLVMAYQNAREGYDIDTPFQRVGSLSGSYVVGNAGHRIDQELSQGGTFRPD